MQFYVSPNWSVAFKILYLGIYKYIILNGIIVIVIVKLVPKKYCLIFQPCKYCVINGNTQVKWLLIVESELTKVFIVTVVNNKQ